MKKKCYADGGIYTADMGQPPMEPDGGSAPPKLPMAKKKKPMPKRPMRPMPPAEAGAGDVTPPATMMKKGGSVGSASRRADGIAQRGKTNCKMV